MAQQRRPATAQRVTSRTIDGALYPVRKLPSRRGLASRRRVFTLPPVFPPSSTSHASVASGSSSPPESRRAVLVPLQFNLRRLPSRTFLDSKESMHDAVPTGSKRKRVVSGSENALASSRSRQKNGVKRRRGLESSDEEASSMDVDERPSWEVTDSEASDDEDGVDSCESSCHRRLSISVYKLYNTADNYLINEATRRQLLRFRKDELVRLYIAAGLTEDAELLTKPEIVDCIIAARDDIASLPPSSPPDARSSGSSDYSSDGGNVAGGEETDFGSRFRKGLARRNTIHDLGQRKGRPPNGDRCYSLPQLQQSERVNKISSQPKIVAAMPKR
jgi:mitogen-activated protein kinase kinase kinase 13